MAKDLSVDQVEQLAKVAKANIGVGGSRAADSLKAISNLKPNVFFTDILNTLNFKKNPFDVFVRQDIMFGDKVRYVDSGIIESQQYGINKPTPDSMGSKFIPDYEDYSTSLIESTFPNKRYDVELTYAFKNYENLTSFINKLRDTNNKSWDSERLNSFLYLFGNEKVKLPEYIKTELKKTRDKIVNVQELGEKVDMKEVFTSIVELAQKFGDSGNPATNEYNIGFAKGSVDESKWNKSSMSDDLVLIISCSDLLNLSKEAADVFHQTFYQGENKFYKVIQADIPKGTCYLLDKEAVRVYPKLNNTIVNYWMDMMTTVTTHAFTHWGIFKYASGCKITFSIKQAG